MEAVQFGLIGPINCNVVRLLSITVTFRVVYYFPCARYFLALGIP